MPNKVMRYGATRYEAAVRQLNDIPYLVDEIKYAAKALDCDPDEVIAILAVEDKDGKWITEPWHLYEVGIIERGEPVTMEDGEVPPPSWHYIETPDGVRGVVWQEASPLSMYFKEKEITNCDIEFRDSW